MSDVTPPIQTPPVVPEAQVLETTAAPVEEAAKTEQSQVEAKKPETKAAKQRSYSELQWRERENSLTAKHSELEQKLGELEAKLQAAAGSSATTESQGDEIDALLARLEDDPSSAVLKQVTSRLNALENENKQLRQVTTRSRAEYWQDHYNKVFGEIKEAFPHLDFDEFVTEFSNVPDADLPKTDAFKFAEKMHEREERAYTRRLDARKDEILKSWGFADGQAPAKVEQQAETKAAAETRGGGKVADKFAPRPGKSPTTPTKKEDEPWVKYQDPKESAGLMARIRARNLAGQAN